MSTLIELCHCGNAKASHHKGKGNCLAVFCTCLEYCSRDLPDTRPKPPEPLNDLDDDEEAA